MEEYLLVALIIFWASLLKGVTGFGFAIVSIPLLLHFISLHDLVSIIALCNLLTSILILLQEKKNPKVLNLKTASLTLWGVVGVLLGVYLLSLLPILILKIFIGVLLAFLSSLFLTGYRFRIRNVKRATVEVGLLSGFLGGVMAVSGPPLALFLTSLNIPKGNFRHLFAIYSTVTTSISLIGYLYMGFVSWYSVKIFLALVPILFLGTFLGKRLLRLVSVRLFYNLCIWISLLSGLSLLGKTIWEIL